MSEENDHRSIINNTFAYPNADSYRSMHRTNGNVPGATSLRHGWIYSMNVANATTNASGGRTVSNILGKKFQFNPFSLQFDLQMVDVDPAESQTPGAAGPGGVGVGAASTGLNLVFNREIEVYKATMGNGSTPSYFKDLGVQKDVLDLYRVLLGEGSTSLVSKQEATLEYLNGELFDSAIAGYSVNQRPVIVSFNRALTYYGKVMGMTYDFQKFNNNMVPTIASVTLTISILNINSSRAIQNAVLGSAATTTAPSTTSGSTSVPNSGTVSGPGLLPSTWRPVGLG